MMSEETVNILMVDDQPAKLLSYEVILHDLGQNLIKANSAQQALEHLLKTEIAVVLVDVCMPELDGFELAAMIREHPRFRRTSIIFVSAVLLSDIDRIKGYESGAVDYVPVPVVPELLRAKVRIFADLYRKTRQLERLNAELEDRVLDRTRELEAVAERLRESERRRDLALAAGRMGSWDWNIVSGEIAWDHGQHGIFGTEPATFTPTPTSITTLVHPDDLDAVRTLYERSAAKGAPFNAEFRIVGPNNSTRWCVVAGTPTMDAEGRAIRISGVTLDITQRKQAEAALTQANANLEQRVIERTREREQAQSQLHEMQKMESLGQLTGGIAHDFNNLLMIVLGNLTLLRKRLPEEPRLLRMIDGAIQGAERGATLTRRMLAFARRQQLKPEAVEVPKLVDNIRDMLARSIGPTIVIATEFQDALPPTLVDPNQLELALLNLVLNARDAMPAGGHLTISARHETNPEAPPPDLGAGDFIRIAVEDTGIGMDDVTLARAAEPFFTSKGTGKGTGLGLSMVHGLAAQSGGALRLRSELGRGTTVEIWLPTTTNGAEERPKPAATGTSAQQRPCRILVVDDDSLVTAGTAAMLEDLGHSVIEATSGARALEALRAGTEVDLVVTDYAMPGMTGVQLAREIGHLKPGLPIVMVTGYAELPSEEASHFRILNKPFRQQELARQISEVLEGTVNLAFLNTAG